MDKFEIKLKLIGVLEGVEDLEELKKVVSGEDIHAALDELVEERAIGKKVDADGQETFF